MSDEMNLEKLRIVQKLGEVDNKLTRVDGSINLMSKTLENIDKRVTTHSTEIWGNGKSGLKMKMDRIIQREIFINWILGISFVSIVGIVSKLIYDILKAGV